MIATEVRRCCSGGRTGRTFKCNTGTPRNCSHGGRAEAGRSARCARRGQGEGPSRPIRIASPRVGEKCYASRCRFFRRFMNNRTRIVLLGLLAVLVAVWGSSASLPLARSDEPRDRRASDAGQTARAVAVRRRRSRLSPARASARIAGAARGRPQSLRVRARARRAAASVIPARAGRRRDRAAVRRSRHTPLFSLSGIVDKAGDQGTVRTAVISGLGQLFFAKVGDAVTARYTVATDRRRRRRTATTWRRARPCASPCSSLAARSAQTLGSRGRL